MCLFRLGTSDRTCYWCLLSDAPSCASCCAMTCHPFSFDLTSKIYSGNVDQPLKPTSWASDTSSAQATSPSAKARLALAASALKVATSRRKITALCLQVIRRWPSSGSVLGRSSKDRESGTQPEYGSAHIDILGEGMETMTLPALMLQAKSVVETSIRAEAYSCLDRLKRPQCE